MPTLQEVLSKQLQEKASNTFIIRVLFPAYGKQSPLEKGAFQTQTNANRKHEGYRMIKRGVPCTDFK